MNEGWGPAQAEMPCAGRMANAAQQWGGEWGLSIPAHPPANATDSAGSHYLEKKPSLGEGHRHQEGTGRGCQTKGGSGGAQCKKPALLCWGIQGSALAEFTLPKTKGLTVSTEINPYGNLLSDATLRRRFLFPITLLISA